MMKGKKIQLASFSFPNNNDKHLEISVFAVTLWESPGTKCQELSNKTTKEQFSRSTDMLITHKK